MGKVHGRSPGLCVHRGSLVRGEDAWPVTWVVCAQREPCEGEGAWLVTWVVCGEPCEGEGAWLVTWVVCAQPFSSH